MPDKQPSESGQTEHPLRPFEGRYWVMMPAAVMSMIPFIISTAAWELFSKDMTKSIGANPGALMLIESMATAGYAFGALMGGDLIHRIPQRVLFLLLETAFVIGAIVAATAQGVWQLGVGFILQGLVTGLLLVVALPPVVRRFPSSRMPVTAAAINMGFFGAITAGPLVGGAVAYAHCWRWYFGGLAGVGLMVLGAAALSLPDQPALDPEKTFDWHAILLAFGATAPSFYAAGILHEVGFAAWRFTVPLGVGTICFVALILVEYHKEEPLSPVKPMWKTYPVIGTLVAMFGGGLFVALLDLGIRFVMQVQHQQPLQAGLTFWPLLPGVVVSAFLLALLVRTRWLPLFILFGMACLTAAAGILTCLSDAGSGALIGGAATLLGLGTGATVSPGLWLAGFALPSKMVGRIFALVELVRSVADFILAPVILEVMHVASSNPHPTAHGVAEASWYVLLIAGASTALVTGLYLIGRPRLPRPDLDRWLQESKPAFESPRLAHSLRKAA